MKTPHTQVKNQTRMVRGCEKGKYTRGTSVRSEFELSTPDLNQLLEGRATRAQLQARWDAVISSKAVKAAIRAEQKAQAQARQAQA